MRATSMKYSFATLTIAAATLAACSGGKTSDGAQDDFKRDLQLASSTTMDLASPKVDPKLLTLETQPKGAPEPAKTLKKGAGSRAVHSKTPTVRAAETELPAVDELSSESTTQDIAPVPEQTTEPVAVAPRPSPTPVVVQSGDGGGDYGTGGNGGGIFGPGGGIGGVIFGGGGDGDHCEPHGRRGGGVYGGRGGVYGGTGGIYIPSGGSVIGRGGGMGRSGGVGGGRSAPRTGGGIGRRG